MPELPNTTEITNLETSGVGGEPVLILGKFKTQEDFERSYTELESKFHEAGKYKTLEEVQVAYQAKLTELEGKGADFKIPDEYSIEVELPDESAATIKAMAKDGGLTQGQLNKIIQSLQSREISKKQEIDAKLEAVEKEVGIDKLTKIDNYVEQTYPASIAQSIKAQCRVDKEAALKFYDIRERAIHKTLPVGGYSGGVPERTSEAKRLAEQLKSNPGDLKARQQFERLFARQ